MLKNASITRNFALTAGAALLLLAAAVTLVMVQMRSIMLDQKRAEIRHTVDAAVTIMQGTYEAAKAGGASDADALKAAGNVLRSSRFDSGNYFYIYDLSGDTLMHPIRKDLEGKNNLGLKDKNGVMIIQEFIKEVQANKAGFTEYHWKKPGDAVESVKIAYNALLPGTKAFVGSGLHVDDVDNALWREAGTLVVKVLPLAALFVLLALYLGRSLSRAVRQLTGSVEGIAAGKLETAIEGVDRADEIGVIARALQVFRDALAENQQAEAEARARRLAERQRQERVDAEIASFERSADSVVLTISSAANQLEAAANELSQVAKHTTIEASTVAAAATQTSTTFHGLASAGEELSGTAAEISRILAESTKAAADAVASVRTTDESAQALASAASRIGSVISLINGLAEQTNLLALNATIEAARAGDAGKGFAVVASEVKALANQTAKATSEISEMVNQIQQATSDTVIAIKEIDGAIALIDRATAEIAGSVGEQERATREIASNVQQAVSGTEEVSRSITAVSATAGHTEGASQQVLGSAADLARQAETMRSEVQRFLQTVRAA
ncbi:MAG: cache domain-containing protein [Beijerinckiaceae bacterium]|jgi:methyl-accepting chemotaxis protein|nr:cache domain-containing protein [Beijerinckiaceae bacterium]